VSRPVAALEWTSDAIRLVVAGVRRGVIEVRRVQTVPHTRSEAVHELLTELAGTHPRRVVVAMPTSAVAHRTLTLPFHGRRQLDRTVPLELRGQLPGDPGPATVGYECIERTRDVSTVLALLARDADVDGVRAQLADAGLAIDELAVAALAPWALVSGEGDAAVLVIDGHDGALSLRRTGQIRAWHMLGGAARNPSGLAAEIGNTLRTWGAPPDLVWVTGPDASPELVGRLDASVASTVRSLDLDATIVGASAETARRYAVPLGLLRADVDREPIRPTLHVGAGNRPRMKRISALAAAAAVLALVDLGLVHHRLDRRAARLEEAITAQAVAALPDVEIVAPRAQLEAAASGTDGVTEPHALLSLLREVARRIPPGLQVDVHQLRLNTTDLHLEGQTPNYETVDALRRSLARSPRLRDVTTDDVRSTVDGAHVAFRVHATWNSPGEAES